MGFRTKLLKVIIYFIVSFIFAFTVHNLILNSDFPMSIIIDKTISIYAVAITISYIFFNKESD